jgi:hypothetical protein
MQCSAWEETTAKKKLVNQPLSTASPMICKPTTGPNLRSNDLLHLSPNWVLLNGMEMEISGKKNGTISLAPLLLPQSTKEMLVISLLDLPASMYYVRT